MNKNLTVGFMAFLAAVLVVGCTQKSASNAQEAIEQAKTKATVQEQVDYLVAQANGFIKNQKFDEASNISQYITTQLDQTSMEAQKIMESAKAGLEQKATEMQKAAEEKAGEMKAEADKAVEDVKGAIGNLGK